LLQTCLATGHLAEVGVLSDRGHRFIPVSPSLQGGVGFFRDPLPAAASKILTDRLVPGGTPRRAYPVP
jgi:hypothetical protein